VQYRAGRVDGEWRARRDLAIMPAGIRRPAQGHHVIGEEAAEAGIGDRTATSFRGDRRCMRRDNEFHIDPH
jgi:hypothetical protein